MRRLPSILLGALVLSAPAWALTSGVSESSDTVTLQDLRSTGPFIPPPWVSTPTVIDRGETISTPTFRGMMMAPGAPRLVTATRTLLPQGQWPANASRVDPEEARAYDAQNAGEMVSRATGLTFLNRSASYPLQARVRGGTPEQTLVLIDGRPMNGVALGPSDLSEIPFEQIDHIEVVRGGLSALYGPNALGGVINVITKRSAYAGFPLSHISYESASYSRQTYRLDFGSRWGRTDYAFYANQQWKSGFRSNGDARQYNIGGNAGVSMGTAGKLQVDASSFRTDTGEPGPRCDITDPYCTNGTPYLVPNRFNEQDEKIASTPNARRVVDSNALRASYLLPLPRDMFLAVRFHGHYRENEFDNSRDAQSARLAYTNRREHSKGVDGQLHLPLGLLVGGSFTHDQEDFLDRLNPGDSFGDRLDHAGVFAQETWQWKSLTVIPSGRYDKNSQFGESVNPRTQVLVDATDRLQLSASAGRSFRTPTFDEVHARPSWGYSGNAGLRPETAWTYEGGFELHESSNAFRANYFRAEERDRISFSSLTAVNLGRARRQGVEVEIRQVVSLRFRHELNYTYLEHQGTLEGSAAYVDLAYSPRHVAHYNAHWFPKPRWGVDSLLRFEDARYSGDDRSGDRLGAQVIWDLRLSYQWRQMEVFLGVNDVLHKRYSEEPGYPLPGRTMFTGIRLRLWG